MRDEYIWCRDILPDRREVLAYPRLLVAKLVECNDLFKVILKRLCYIRAGRVQRHSKEADFHFEPP